MKATDDFNGFLEDLFGASGRTESFKCNPV